MKSIFKNGNSQTMTSSSQGIPSVRASADTVLEQHLAKDDIHLGPIARLIHNKESGRILREKLTEMSAALIEKQKQELSQKLMLDLDLAKKRAFAAYQSKVGELNAELIHKSNEMERDLTEMMFVAVERIYEDKRRWETRIGGAELTQEELEKELKRVADALDFAIDQVEGKVELMVQSQSRSLQVTLELLRDKTIRGDDAIG